MRRLVLPVLVLLLGACASTIPAAPRGRDVSRAGGVTVSRTLVADPAAVASAATTPAPFDLAAFQGAEDDE